MYNLGDIVLVPRGQKTRFFEVIKVDDKIVWVSDGYIQTSKTFEEVELICQASDRKDNKVPVMRYWP